MSHSSDKESPWIIDESQSDRIAPMVSISCITYNHEKYIKDAIESFLMQKTSFAVEVLIHDDASTDRTASIIKDYEKRYPNIIKPIYQTENQYSKHDGTIFRLQNERIKGKYIAACEGDDYWTDPLKLQKQVDFLEEHPEFSMCVHNSVIHYENGEHPDTLFNAEDQKPIITTEDLINKWSFTTASIVFRRSMMKQYSEHPYLKKVYNGDLFLALMLSLEGPIYSIPDVMSVYRRFMLEERYKGKERFFLKKRIELLQIFNEISDHRYQGQMETTLKKFKSRLFIQELYGMIPVLKVMRGFIPQKIRNKIVRSL